MSGTQGDREKFELTPEILLRAYAAGLFPMAESRDDPELFWVDPEYRGILPLEHFHISRSLRKLVRQKKFEIRFDSDFDGVILGCAEPTDEREETWINDQIIRLYTKLFEMGNVHTVECWHRDRLVGGLYGVTLKSAFFGESMFTIEPNASKVALVHLMARLRHGGYRLLDTQFVTDHLRSLGAIEVPRQRYHELLDEALSHSATFYSELPEEVAAESIEGLMQSRTHTS